MAKGSSKRWKFSKRRFTQGSVKQGTIVLIEGSFFAHRPDGSVKKVNGLVGKKTASHTVQVFPNRKRNTVGGICNVADNDSLRVRLKNRRRK